jgi:hypothetical protein
MRMLLGFAVTLAAAIPAQAQNFVNQGGGGTGVSIHRGGGEWTGQGHRRHRRDDAMVVGDLGYYGGEWALYNNRSWEPDSYNDWWHDRPDRSFPRWMAGNQDCARKWWSGGGWRC